MQIIDHPNRISNQRPVSSQPLAIALGLLHHLIDGDNFGDPRRVLSLNAEHFPCGVAAEQKKTDIVVRTTDCKAGHAAQPLTVNVQIEPASESSRFGDYNVCDQVSAVEKLARWFHPKS